MGTLLFKIANIFMGNGTLLADVNASKVAEEFAKVVATFINPLLIIASSAGAVYAIVLGVKMAKADDKAKRDEAKANLINVIIAIVAVVLLILLFNALTAYFKGLG